LSKAGLNCDLPLTTKALLFIELLEQIHPQRQFYFYFPGLLVIAFIKVASLFHAKTACITCKH